MKIIQKTVSRGLLPFIADHRIHVAPPAAEEMSAAWI
jgi:hypothetical protein